MLRTALLFVLIVCQTMALGMSFTQDPAPRILDAAEKVLDVYERGDRTPTYRGVSFESAYRYGRCQQNVRELIEAALFGGEGSWPESGCCATQTERNLRRASLKGRYIRVTDLERVQPGDLVYMDGGGTRCSGCGRGAGHAMICVAIKNGTHVFWQNLLGLCEEPLRDWQRRRFEAAYRIPFEPKPKPLPSLEERLTNDSLLLIRREFESVGTKVTSVQFLLPFPQNVFPSHPPCPRRPS